MNASALPALHCAHSSLEHKTRANIYPLEAGQHLNDACTTAVHLFCSKFCNLKTIILIILYKRIFAEAARLHHANARKATASELESGLRCCASGRFYGTWVAGWGPVDKQ